MLDNKARSRRTRFHARIATEREVLSIVNSSDFCRDLPLAGMTSQAIADWESRAREKLEQGWAAKITDLLLEIGRRTELLADDSRDVFRVDQLVEHNGVDPAMMALQQLMSRLSHN